MPDKRILLVEGNDDKHVLLALLARHQIPDCFEIRDLKGIDPVMERLPVFLRASDITRLGVMVDADAHLAGRWLRITQLLEAAGYPGPDILLDPEGTVIAAKALLPRVGVWLMPDNARAGILEDFLAELAPANDPLWSHAETALNTLPEHRFPAVRRPKAHLHTWLAWQAEPGSPPGQAITKRYLNGDHSQAQALLAWVRRLFVDP